MLAPGQALLRGIVFDLDGTLTIPCLDFKKLKNQLQIDDHVDVLGYVGTLCDEERKKAMQIIADFEAEGRNNLKLQPGLDDLFRYIGEETKLKLAVLTRNNMNGVEHFLSKCKEFGLSYVRQDIFSIILTRDFKPVKPDPAPVLHIASQWDIMPKNIIVIGDHKQDILCGQQAGSTTILVNNESNKETRRLADLNVDSLSDIIPIIKAYLAREEQEGL